MSAGRYSDLPDGVDDPYEFLGVDRFASKKSVRSAYRAKALILHPDKNRNNKKADDKFKVLKEVYEFLKDDKRRTGYDEWLKRAEQKKQLSQKFDAEKRRFAEELSRREAAAAKGKPSSTQTERRSSVSADAKIKRLRKENEDFLRQMQAESAAVASSHKEPRQGPASSSNPESEAPPPAPQGLSESFEADILKQMGEMV